MKNPAVRAIVFEQKVILGLSIPLAALLILCSAVGLLYPEIYATSTPNWLMQTVAQDGIDLFIVTPVLIVAALYSFQGIKAAIIMWGGTVAYLVYTFVIYCFAVRFNVLFLPYCLILGLSVFSLFWFFVIQLRNPTVRKMSNKLFRQVTGTYFITIAVSFGALWLFEIIPATIRRTVPESLATAGLLTNPVHALDLSIFLPIVLISGVLTIKKNPIATILIPVVLVFLVLMDITIAVLTVVLIQQGLGGQFEVAIAMGGFALISMGLLTWFITITKDEIGN